jgi:predicted nucleic acid-binding protein
MQTVYIETSVVSFLRENPSASSESVDRQTLTRRWWNMYRHRYELVTSQYVLDEASVGQADLAQERLNHLAGVPLVPLSDRVEELAAQIMARAILPQDAIVDALHIASAAVSRVDYLLTWNCSHIANPMILPRVFRTLDDFALPFPVICTPKDMLEEYGDGPAT